MIERKQHIIVVLVRDLHFGAAMVRSFVRRCSRAVLFLTQTNFFPAAHEILSYLSDRSHPTRFHYCCRQNGNRIVRHHSDRFENSGLEAAFVPVVCR